MFTGIIQSMGRVVRAERSGGAVRLAVDLGPLADGLQAGDSAAVDGVCLTATAIAGSEATLDVGAESLHRTTLGDFRAGRRVNLELPVAAGRPLGGHIVQGHVDGVGTVSRITRSEGGCTAAFSVPRELGAQMVVKGSVAVDGVSLTISALREAAFEVYVIPYTLSATTLSERRVGDRVNIETDIIGKYVARYLSAMRGQSGVTGGMLEEHGFK